MMFKQIVRAVAMRNGIHASFLPKPLPDQAGSGLHINLSLCMDCLLYTSKRSKKILKHWKQNIKSINFPQFHAVYRHAKGSPGRGAGERQRD